MIIYLIGQPGAGKTTLSHALRARIEFQHPKRPVIIIDGDELRKVQENQDYSEAGRRKNIMLAQQLAGMIIDAAKVDKEFRPIVILALVSPYVDLREIFKTRYDVKEVFLFSQRELKKEYHVKEYEMPESDFLPLGTDIPLYDCLGYILNYSNITA